jgi:pSer/pThr/pTyr-binding forkhead associated (FHA) protein
LAHPVIGLEICGDVVIGRSSNTAIPDLDLTRHDAAEYGVSRKHALLRIAEEGLQLIDLGSLNGTRCNGTQLTPEVPQVLHHEDVIEFGNLKFQFKIVDKRN